MRAARGLLAGTAVRRAAGRAGRGLVRQARAADWFAVALDVLIVIVGILIAFQVDRWWDHRKKLRDEREYMQRLAEDAAANHRAVAARARTHREAAADALAVRRALGDEAALGGMARDRGRFCRIMYLPDVLLANTAYQELAGAGRLELLRDRELRGRLRAATARHAYVSAQLAYFRSAFIRIGGTLDPYLQRYRIGPGGEPVCDADLAGLARDPAAADLLTRVYRDQRAFAEFREAEAEEVAAVRARLACLLSDDGCPRG